MRNNIIPAQVFLPPGAIKLGRFVTSAVKPHLSRYHDPPVLELGAYTGDHHVTGGSHFSAIFTALVSANLTRRTNTNILVVTNIIKKHALEKSEDWFKEATQLQPTRLWIEQAVDRGLDIYLVVGFHTTTDASISQELVAKSNSEGQILPVDLAFGAAGLKFGLVGNAINPKVVVQRVHDDGKCSKYQVPGEQICAVEYRKVSHEWLKRKDINNLKLSKAIYWLSMEQCRCEDEEEDIIKVEMTDMQDLVGAWDKEIAEDETVFMEKRQRGEETEGEETEMKPSDCVSEYS